MTAAKQQYEESRRQVEGLTGELQQQRQANSELSAKVAALQSRLDEARAALASEKEASASLRAELDRLAKELRDVQSMLVQREQQLQQEQQGRAAAEARAKA
eukprot:306170-Chlamydomonas_euryale.AAC.1